MPALIEYSTTQLVHATLLFVVFPPKSKQTLSFCVFLTKIVFFFHHTEGKPRRPQVIQGFGFSHVGFQPSHCWV